MKKYLVFSLLAFSGLGLATVALAETSSDLPRLKLEINHSGHILVRGAVVTSMASSTINASLTWPNGAKVDWVINVPESEFVNRLDRDAKFSEIQNGHVISFSGELTGGSSSGLAVKAKVVKNWSVQKVKINPFGIIQSINSAAKSFVVQTEERGSPTVFVSGATEIIKNKATATFEALRVGDRAHVKGLWDRAANTIQAERIKVFVENRRVFENGRLKSLAGTSRPTTAVVTFKGIDYTINLDVDTAVIKKNWAPVNLSDFEVGDHLRVYGVPDGTTIEATVVRNMNLP